MGVLTNPNGGLFELNPIEIQTTLSNWQDITTRNHFSSSIGKLGSALGKILGGVSIVITVEGDAMYDMFMHTIANADTLERIEILDEFITRSYDPNSEEYRGYQLAKQDALHYIDEDFNAIQAGIDSIVEHGIGNIVYLASLINSAASYFHLISGEFSFAVSQVILPYSWATSIGVQLYTELDALRTLCATVTLLNTFYQEDTRLELIFSAHRQPLDALGYDAGRKILRFVKMEYALGYSYYNKWDEILAVAPLNLNPLDWIQFIVQFLTGQWGSVQAFRADLVNYKNDIISYTNELIPFLEQ